MDVVGGMSTTGPVDADRGAGRPEATYLVELIVERAAQEMNMEPAELSRKNFIQPEDFRYRTPVALEYDIGDYEASLDKALAMADYAGFSARREASVAEGKLRGIGFSCYIEACGLAPSQAAGSLAAGVGLTDSGVVHAYPTGFLTVMTRTHSLGPGHVITFPQLHASPVAISLADV